MISIDEAISKLKRLSSNIIPEDELVSKLKSNKRLVIKFGADPSRPDLHLGHTVVIRALKIFQDLGHEVVFVIGDFTGMIGDPSGKSKTRPNLTYEETRNNAKSYFDQITKILTNKKPTVVYNSEWFSGIGFEEVLKLCSTYTVAQILERDDFSKRFKSNTPIAIHELMYPLMQGYDSVMLKADVELGGNDQTFNLLVGRELQKHYNQDPQSVIVFPLLVGLDGKEKMSKSLDNYIGVSDSNFVMFEKAMKIPDNVLLDYFKLTTDYDIDNAEEIINKDIVEAHFVYARLLTQMYHSKEAAVEAEKRYNEVAKGNIPNAIKEIKTDKKVIGLIEMLTTAGFCKSNSEARKLIIGGGVKVNNEKVTDYAYECDTTKNPIVSKGKNKFAKFIFSK